MKRYILCIIISMFASCTNSSNSTEGSSSDPNRITEINITSVDFYSSTNISVDCDIFCDAFTAEEKVITCITDADEINRILNLIDKKTPTGKNGKVDTRAKIYLCSETDTIAVCLDFFTLYMNNEYYKAPGELVEYIEKLNSEHK